MHSTNYLELFKLWESASAFLLKVFQPLQWGVHQSDVKLASLAVWSDWANYCNLGAFFMVGSYIFGPNCWVIFEKASCENCLSKFKATFNLDLGRLLLKPTVILNSLTYSSFLFVNSFLPYSVTRFGEILKVLGKILITLWQKCYAIGQVCIVVEGQIFSIGIK